MLIATIALGYLIVFGCGMVLFGLWIIKQYRDGRAYRRLIKLHEIMKDQTPTQKGWVVQYKDKGKILSEIIDKPTEQEAVAVFIKTRPDRVQSIIAIKRIGG